MSSIGQFSALDISSKPTRLERGVHYFNRRWILFFSIILGLYVGLPFLAPVFMKMGWESPARLIYFTYSFFCHQLPQRSYFLFGPKVTYSLPEIQSMWQNTLNPLVLRRFIGNPETGWKVAWSDRMVSMYTSIWLFGLLWWSFRRRLKPLPWWGFLLFLLPMALDGSSHLVSDLFGIGQGFRDSNTWLAIVTNNSFTPGFYSGDAWGSFNSLMRLLTGVLFGAGVVWFGFPYLEAAFSPPALHVVGRQDFSHYQAEAASKQASSSE